MLYLQIASPKSSVLNFLDSNSFEVIISIFQRTEKVPDMERLRQMWRLLSCFPREWSIGPFSWGKDAKEAVHNAVVLEEVAKMAYRIELIHPQVAPAPQELQDKHYFCKQGANAYYGQN